MQTALLMSHWSLRCIALLLALGSAATRLSAAPRDITVHFDKPQGTIRHLLDLHSAPINARGSIDLSDYYRELGVQFVRLHDSVWTNDHAADMHIMFPRFEADADNPNNYQFLLTDQVVHATTAIGAQPLFRLGESAELANRTHNIPPADFDKWAKIGVNVIRHYNAGWANGFHDNIRYWEIWNEPDIKNFWTGSFDDYCRLYEVTVRAIKKFDPTLKVGGPALAGHTDLLDKFLKYCTARQLPVDFISWHGYGTVPYATALATTLYRDVALKNGYTKTELIFDEWNYFPGDWDRMHNDMAYTQGIFARIHGMEGAAYDAATLTFLQDSPIDRSNFYTGSTMWWGLFDPYGVPHPAFYAFRAFRQLMDTPQRVQCEGSDLSGFATIAGLDAVHTAATLLVSNLGSDFDQYQVTFASLPWSGPTRFELYRLAGAEGLKLTASGDLTGNQLQIDQATAPSIVLVRLASSTGGSFLKRVPLTHMPAVVSKSVDHKGLDYTPSTTTTQSTIQSATHALTTTHTQAVAPVITPSFPPLPASDRPIPVELVKRGDKYGLLRDGKSYFCQRCWLGHTYRDEQTKTCRLSATARNNN